MKKNKKALVLAGSKGIGKSIFLELQKIIKNVNFTNSKDFDMSLPETPKLLINKYNNLDIIVLNTGGPPMIDFYQIRNDQWIKYFNQLFLSFVRILQTIKINKNGYVFLISSSNIKEPHPSLALSNSYRVALTSIFKTYSTLVAKDNISCINIMPGAIKTKRLETLVADMDAFEKLLPFNKTGNPKEIGLFISSIISNNIKYLSGASINFDGANSKSLF